MAQQVLLSLSFTAQQNTAINTALNALEAKIKPFLALYRALTPAQQATLVAHNPTLLRLINLYGG